MSSLESSSSNGPWTPPTVEELHEMIPQYEIEAMLGRGGMGAVYLGKQKALERSVAIKILPLPENSEEDEHHFVERFKLEAKAMAGLDHPAIISVFDFGQTSAGLLYFVMEYVDGMDIQKYIQLNDGVVAPEHSLAIVSHVLDALDYAHSKGIIHRDIKPANVLINQEGKVKIADFGLAKQIDSDDPDESVGLTMSNVAVGTPDYIAPETFDPDLAQDHRADLYAVGVMLYQMLTGRLPRGLFKLPSELNDSIDPRFDKVISLSLESDPEHRYQSATEFRGKVGELLSKPVPKVVAADQELPSNPSMLIVPGRSVAAVPGREFPKSRQVQRKGSFSSLGWVIAVLLLLSVGLWYFFRPNVGGREVISQEPRGEITSQPEPGPPRDFSEPQPTRAIPDQLSTASAGSWPTGPHYQSAGKFRAWSSLPDDPTIDIEKLAEVTDPKQVLCASGLWVVLRENGETLSSNPLAEKQGIAKIAPGAKAISLITEEGELSSFSPRFEHSHPGAPKDFEDVTDAYVSWHYSIALTSESGFRLWGPSVGPRDLYKGSTAPEWSKEFVANPIPEGLTPVSIQGSNNNFSIVLSDGSILVRFLNHVAIHERPFLDAEVSAFVDSGAIRVGIPSSGGQAISTSIRLNSDLKAKGISHQGEARHLVVGGDKVMILNAEGVPYIFPESGPLEKQIAEVVALIPYAKPGLISLGGYEPKDGPEVLRIIWFETVAPGETLQEQSEERLTLDPYSQPKSPKQEDDAPVAMDTGENPLPVVSPEAEEGGPAPDVPLLKKEIVRFQKERLGEFSTLVDLYLNSLRRINEKPSATDPGVVSSDAKSIQEWRTHSLSRLQSFSVAPIPPPPALPEAAPKGLQRNRGILAKQIKSIDGASREKFEHNMRRVISDLHKSKEHVQASSAETYRKSLAREFPTSAVEGSRPSKNRELLPSVLTGMSLRQGKLKMWSNQRDDPVADMERSEGRDDFVQVYLFEGGWIALAADGTTVSSEAEYDRVRVARICRGWESSFGLIDFDGTLEAITVDGSKPEKPISNVADAFISEVHSIALLENGRVETWGPAYRGETGDRIPWQPAPKNLRRIAHVRGGPTVGAAVSEDGILTAWTLNGPGRFNNQISLGIKGLTSRSSGLRIIGSEGYFHWWNAKDNGSRNRVDLMEEIGPISEIFDSMNINLFRAEGGGEILTDNLNAKSEGIGEPLRELKGYPEHAFSIYDDRALIRVIWIEFEDQE